MKARPFILLLCMLVSPPIFAEDILPIHLTLNIVGVRNHTEFKTIINDIKHLNGETDLTKTKESVGDITLQGSLAVDPLSFKTDLQSLIVDRYKLEEKRSDDKIYITLKKL